jgi:hypothetical protein
MRQDEEQQIYDQHTELCGAVSSAFDVHVLMTQTLYDVHYYASAEHCFFSTGFTLKQPEEGVRRGEKAMRCVR